MNNSIEKIAKRDELETKMVLDGRPTKVSVESIEVNGRYYVKCIVDSIDFDAVDVLDQIRLWASLFGVELPSRNIRICYRESIDEMEEEFDLLSGIDD